MFKVLQIIILGSSLFGCSSLDYKVDYNNLAFNMVKKINFESGGHCSSTFIKYKNKIRHVTNAHCCKEQVYYNEEPVNFKQVDIPNDLCELDHNYIPNYGLDLSISEVKTGDIVYNIGFPLVFIITKSMGEISDFKYTLTVNKQPLTATTALTLPGMSGGAAINSDGKLIGIVSQTNGMGEGRFIPLETVKEFLDK